MKNLYLTCGFLMAASISAQAVLFLPEPQVLSEEVEGNKLKLEWQFESEDVRTPHFHIILFKSHVATEEEEFVLAEYDFSNLESKGTMTNHEERGAVWDIYNVPAGWRVKYPTYMQGAMGIDTFNYFSGSDNDDIFGGAYMLSPDFDLSGLTDPTVKIESALANEAISVSGGYVLYTWNTDWWDERNIDYKPIIDEAVLYEDLSNLSWKETEDYMVPDQYLSRTRIAFYGSGYSTYWINHFTASVNMKPGDRVVYPYAFLTYRDDERSLETEIDLTGDETVAYQLVASREDYDDYRELYTTRFVSPSNRPYKVIGSSDVFMNEAVASDNLLQIRRLDGTTVYEGTENGRPTLDSGIYVMTRGGKSYKIAVK